MTEHRCRVGATALDGLKVLHRRSVGGSRGCLERLVCVDGLHDVFAAKSIPQVNRTLTARRGAIQGMHFQYPLHAETKLVTCLRGIMSDVEIPQNRDDIFKQAEFRSPKRMCVPHGRIKLAILPRNLRGELERQLHYIREWGGCFVTAIPQEVSACE